MFCAAVTLSHLEKKPEVLEKKLIVLGRQKAGWSERETRSCIQTVVSRTRSADAGETLEWEGKHRDPRYCLTNEEIIRRLKITPEEQELLETIISAETKRQRNTEQKRQKRREEGAVPRDKYEAAARERSQHHRTQAKRLHEKGIGVTEIGRRLGVSHTQVSRLLKTQQ
jgi:DNA invertase Pin-like site-specific DNA recombinase